MYRIDYTIYIIRYIYIYKIDLWGYWESPTQLLRTVYIVVAIGWNNNLEDCFEPIHDDLFAWILKTEEFVLQKVIRETMLLLLLLLLLLLFAFPKQETGQLS